MNEIPKNWQEKPHYEPAVLWFTREARTRTVLGQQLMAEPSQEYPGWFFYFRADTRMLHESLQEALTELKSILKHWRMEDRFGTERIALQPSKDERKRMVVQLLEYPIPDPTPPFDPESDPQPPERVHLQWEFGDHLLVVSLGYSPFREEFTTTIGSADNPIRSLVGKVCTLQAATEADLERELDDEDFEAEWKEIALGPVAFQDNRLMVGFWSHTFDPDTPVTGVAFEEASFFDPQTGISYFLEKGSEQ